MNGRNIALGILVYYWVILGIFAFPFPRILPDPLVTYTTIGSVGWLIRDYSQDSSDDYCRRMSPQLITERGIFSWDGSTYYVPVSGRKFALFYGNGCNYDGNFYRGDVAILCPPEMVVDCGTDRIVTVRFKPWTVPRDLVFDTSIRAVLYGDLPSPVFDVDVPVDSHMLSTQLDCQRQLVETYQGGMNRVIAVLNAHSNFIDLSKKVDIMDSRLVELGRRMKPDRPSEYYDGLDEGKEYDAV